MSSIVEQVGRVIGGRYRLLAVVGAGASAQVFAADDTRLSRRVAVKLLHPALAGDATFLRKFQAEARLAASLNHRNVLHVYDWGDEDGVPYLVLEYLGGGSLRSLLDTGFHLSPQQAAAVGAEAANGLAYAHRRGLVHRDIKPANLLFDDDGRLLVADFGLARALAEAAITEPLGTVMGTARYASPEQVEGRPVDDRTDVYSLALTLYESVTGRVPFAGETTVATLMARVGAVLPPARELGPLAPILAQAAISEPLARLDAAAFAYELELLLLELDAPGPLPLTRVYIAAPAVARGLERDPTERFGLATPQAPAAQSPTPPTATHVPAPETRPTLKWSIELDEELPEIDFGPTVMSTDPAGGARQTEEPLEPVDDLLSEGLEAPPASSASAQFGAETVVEPGESVEDLTGADLDSVAAQRTLGELGVEAVAGLTEGVEDLADIGSQPVPAQRLGDTTDDESEPVDEFSDLEDFSDVELEPPSEVKAPVQAVSQAADERAEPVEDLSGLACEPVPASNVPVPPFSEVAGQTPPVEQSTTTSQPAVSAEVPSPAEPSEQHAPQAKAAPAALSAAPAVAQLAARVPAPPVRSTPEPLGPAVVSPVAQSASPQSPPSAATGLSGVRRISTAVPTPSSVTEPPRARKHRWLPWLLVVLVAELAAGTALVVHSRVVKRDTVPSVSGLRFSAARAAIARTGLYPELIGEQFSERVAVGGVISQLPSRGRTEKAGSIVKVVISEGPHPTVVPSLSGLSGSKAATALHGAHLVAHLSKRYSETIASGTVVSWSSVAGLRVFYGDVVDVVVSKGPMPQMIPVDLAGGVRTWTQAEAALSDLHLLPAENPRYSTTIPAGFVLTTQPAPGTTVPGHSKVLVFVSQGPPFVTVPPLRGTSAAAAEKSLTSLGFKWLPYGPAGASTVLLTDPGSGQSVRYGTTVDIYLGT